VVGDAERERDINYPERLSLRTVSQYSVVCINYKVRGVI
jgi:hypothetical protein